MSTSDPRDPREEMPRSSGCMLAGVVAIIVVAILFALVALVRFVIFPSSVKPPEQKRAAAVGQKLPRLALQPLTGTDKPVALADLSGKVVLVNFWGTWCPPCREEIPHLAALYRDLAGRKDFQMLAVSCPQGPGPTARTIGELREETAAFVEMAGLPMPTYADTDAATRRAYAELDRFAGYPTTFVLDREGVIRGVWVGFRPEAAEEMRAVIRDLLGGQEPNAAKPPVARQPRPQVRQPA